MFNVAALRPPHIKDFRSLIRAREVRIVQKSFDKYDAVKDFWFYSENKQKRPIHPSILKHTNLRSKYLLHYTRQFNTNTLAISLYSPVNHIHHPQWWVPLISPNNNMHQLESIHKRVIQHTRQALLTTLS